MIIRRHDPRSFRAVGRVARGAGGRRAACPGRTGPGERPADTSQFSLGVDPSSSGSSARVALTYYFYPNAACTAATCQLDVGFVSSPSGGATWSASTMLAGPMSLADLAATTQGRMVGD